MRVDGQSYGWSGYGYTCMDTCVNVWDDWIDEGGV